VLAPFCAAGKPASFVLGLAELNERLGHVMGESVACEHVNPTNGDTLQKATGLATYAKAMARSNSRTAGTFAL